MRGQRVTVMGLGLHGGGVSVVQWFLKHGARVTVTDLKTKKELGQSLKQLKTYHLLPITYVFGRHRKRDFINTDMVVRNPAVPVDSPFLKVARQHGVPIENEATLFFKHCRSKNIIGVTGTRGKSTTAAMIHAILHKNIKTVKHKNSKVWLAGNIRITPMFSIVDRVKPDDWVVLELSSWHLEDMDRQKMSPHIAVVTNILQDHLNRYPSMRAYARAKETIVRHQKKGDIAVLNRENIWTRAMTKKTKVRVVWFDARGRSSVPQRTVLRVFGDHNFSNATAAAATARAVGIPLRTISSALRTFRGLPDRQEIIRTFRGVTYVNDTTATTPDATIAALKTFSQKHIILIAGGSDKNLNYKPLIPWIERTCKAIILLPGTATEKIRKHLSPSQSMSSAVRTAAALATRGDIVLLSPAAASFGLFQHEFDRGEQFRKAVVTLK